MMTVSMFKHGSGLSARALLIAGMAMLVFASGCTSLKPANTELPPASTPTTTTAADVTGEVADDTIRHDTVNVRVAQLWAQAERARLAGDEQAASRLILQALDMEPDDGVLLSRAAELQLNLGEPVLAESYAVRSNALAESNRSLLLRNWLIIEYAREVRGDLLGVRTAHNMVQQLR